MWAGVEWGKTIEATADLMQEYYRPGRIVRGFGGADKVLHFQRDDPRFRRADGQHRQRQLAHRPLVVGGGAQRVQGLLRHLELHREHGE